MSKRNRYITYILALLVLLGPAVMAQEAAQRTLLETYVARHLEAWRYVNELSYQEQLHWVRSGAQGSNEVAVVRRLTGNPQNNTWKEDIDLIERNGRTIAPQQVAAQWRRVSNMLGNDVKRLMQIAILPPRLLMRMDQVGEPVEAVENGTRYWKVEVVPGENRRVSPIKAMTLWFDQDTGALARSHIDIERRGSHLSLDTDYSQIEGFDLPTQSVLEGTTQQTRRGQVYTFEITVTSTFDAFAVSFGRSSGTGS